MLLHRGPFPPKLLGIWEFRPHSLPSVASLCKQGLKSFPFVVSREPGGWGGWPELAAGNCFIGLSYWALPSGYFRLLWVWLLLVSVWVWSETLASGIRRTYFNKFIFQQQRGRCDWQQLSTPSLFCSTQNQKASLPSANPGNNDSNLAGLQTLVLLFKIGP